MKWSAVGDVVSRLPQMTLSAVERRHLVCLIDCPVHSSFLLLRAFGPLLYGLYCFFLLRVGARESVDSCWGDSQKTNKTSFLAGKTRILRSPLEVVHRGHKISCLARGLSRDPKATHGLVGQAMGCHDWPPWNDVERFRH